YFGLTRWDADQPFRVGAAGRCRVVVGVSGRAVVRAGGDRYPVGPGSVWLIPASVGECECVPDGRVTILECTPPG
ncbi:MAG TPA: hypothetical protein VM597_22450, partial [Gemmataceae bacterium]|nr:hypothetical protein [Gemmataceae bacterium]